MQGLAFHVSEGRFSAKGKEKSAAVIEPRGVEERLTQGLGNGETV